MEQFCGLTELCWGFYVLCVMNFSLCLASGLSFRDCFALHLSSMFFGWFHAHCVTAAFLGHPKRDWDLNACTNVWVPKINFFSQNFVIIKAAPFFGCLFRSPAKGTRQIVKCHGRNMMCKISLFFFSAFLWLCFSHLPSLDKRIWILNIVGSLSCWLLILHFLLGWLLILCARFSLAGELPDE